MIFFAIFIDPIALAYVVESRELVVFVNGRAVLWTEPLLQTPPEEVEDPRPMLDDRANLYPVLDCFASTVALELLNSSIRPPSVNDWRVPEQGKVKIWD